MPDTTEKTDIARRAFCARMLMTSAGVVLMASQASANSQTDNSLMYPPKKIDGAEHLMPGEYLYFDYPRANDAAILMKNLEGQYMAFSRKCAHLGCSVNFDVMRRCLICPCHRGAYDTRTGSVIYGPPPRPLDQVILQIRGGGEVWAVGKSLSANDPRA